jgi:hypothetical protein
MAELDWNRFQFRPGMAALAFRERSEQQTAASFAHHTDNHNGDYTCLNVFTPRRWRVHLPLRWH